MSCMNHNRNIIIIVTLLAIPITFVSIGDCFTLSCFHLFTISVTCGTPAVPPNGIIVPYASTTEGAQAIILG